MSCIHTYVYCLYLDETALIVLPTLLGMVWAFQGNGRWRIEQLRLLFTGRLGGFTEIIDHLPFTSAANQTSAAAAAAAAAAATTATEVEFLMQYAGSNIALKTQQVERLIKIVSCIQFTNSFM